MLVEVFGRVEELDLPTIADRARVWLVMIAVSYGMHWQSSVVYVSALSLWALVAGHWSSWQAARVEVAQGRELETQRDEPIEEKVVEKLVNETDVQTAEA